MLLTRRSFLASSASCVGLAATSRLKLALASPASVPPTAAAKALRAQVGDAACDELLRRLRTVNTDIQTRGLRSLPGAEGSLLTGYPYNKFYDWDRLSKVLSIHSLC